MKPFKVATFYNAKPGKPPTASKINAYTLWYNPAWPGCIVYEVDAANGADAKRQAVRRRLGHEFGLPAVAAGAKS